MHAKIVLGILGGLLFLTTPAAAGDGRIPSDQDLDACLMEIQDLRADINLLNLINGMHFTEVQIKGILREARSLAGELGPALEAERETVREMDEELKLLRAVRDSLHENREVPSALKARCDVMEERRRRDRTGWRAKPQVVRKVEESARRVQDLLTPAQQEVLAVYKPCLLPPRDLKNPVRVGQAGSTGPAARFLGYVRDLPDPVIRDSLEDILEKAVAAIEHHYGAFEAKERAAFIARLRETIERARSMDDVEFQLNSDELAAGLEPVDRVKAIKESLGEMGVVRYKLEGKIVQNFLTPRIIPLLEERLQRMKEAAREIKGGSR